MEHTRGTDAGCVVRAAGRLAAALRGGWWHGGVLEGSVAAAMVAGTSALAGLPLDGPLLVLAFCGTLLVYHLDRTPVLSPEDRLNHPARWRWRRTCGGQAATLAGLAALGACWALPQLRMRTLAAGFALAGPAAAYALPLFGSDDGGNLGDDLGGGGSAKRRLKDVGPAKPFIVAAAWALGSVGMPALEASAPASAGSAGATGAAAPLALLASYRFLFVLPNLLLADAADRDGDARAGLRTVATTAARAPRRLRRAAVGVWGACAGGGALAGVVFDAPGLLAVDLAALLALLGGALLVGRRWGAHGPSTTDRLLARAADLAMLGPGVTAAAAAAPAGVGMM